MGCWNDGNIEICIFVLIKLYLSHNILVSECYLLFYWHCAQSTHLKFYHNIVEAMRHPCLWILVRGVATDKVLCHVMYGRSDEVYVMKC